MFDMLPLAIPAGATDFSLLKNVQTGSGTRGSFQGIKRPERDVDRSSPFSVEVENDWSCNSAPLYAFMAWKETILPLALLLHY
jgi:hypothetical protein